MPAKVGPRVLVVLLSVFVGLVLAGRAAILSTLRHDRQRLSTPAGLLGAPARPSGGAVQSWLRVRELRILNRDSTVAMRLGASREDTAEIWLTNASQTAVIDTGVHGNGFPFLLVSDGAQRNFGLGRVDGPNASPIVVFRSDDLVRMVLGLSMTEQGQPPFLVRYTADGRRHDVIGRYCDRPDRVCTQ
jgi:hypothetical protein